MTTGGVEHGGEATAEPTGAAARGTGDDAGAMIPAPRDSDEGASSTRLERIAAAGAVLQAFADGTLEVPDPAPVDAARPAAEEPAPAGPPDPATEAPLAPTAEAGAPATPTEQPPPLLDEVRFRPRTGRRRLLGVLLVLTLAGTGLTAWRAYADPAVLTLRICATFAIAAGVLWVLRAHTTVPRISLVGTRLEVQRDGTRLVFDLADPHTGLRIEGRPGERGWRAVIPRRGMDPVVIDARMVDPRAFTAAVEDRRRHGPGTKVPG